MFLLSQITAVFIGFQDHRLSFLKLLSFVNFVFASPFQKNRFKYKVGGPTAKSK